MGVVWRAVDEKSQQVVAVKRATKPAGGDSERVRRRMRREAHIAATLSHPHIVAFIDEVVEDRERWLVMEYVPAQSLAQILDQFGPLAPHQVTHIGVQIASALEAVHAQGILHRDIKPGNILVTGDGTAKLTDFGISRPIYGDVTATDSGLIGGTVAFLASEVADGEEPTPASDVFALGATLFAAVEGIPPFGTADNPLLVLRRAAAGDLLPVRRAGPLTPILSALLQPDPAKRPDAAQARHMLQELAAGAEGPQTWRWPVASRARRRSRRRAVTVTGSCVLALAAVAGLLAFRPDDPTPATPLTTLGDPRTADPCALTDTAVLSRFGATNQETAYGNFDRCDVIVTSSGGARVQVKVELEKPATPGGTMGTRGGFAVFRRPEDNGYCDRTVLLADQHQVTITAKLLSDNDPGDNGPADLCAMADAATDHVVAVLGKGVMPRRVAPPDAASLARMDACPLLDPGTVTRVLGADVSGPEAGFGDWECRWDSSTSGLSVLLAFDRNIPLTSADGNRVELGGRDVYLKPETDEPACRARVVYRSGVDEDGDRTDELLKVLVEGPRTADQLCGPATELAAAAVAKLPPS